MSPLHSLSITALSTVLLAACTPEIRPRAEPAGTETSAKLKTLETGAAVLQSNAPAEKLDVYIVAFHPLASDPSKQMEVHHYCHQLNQDVMQCALFDGNTGDAVLNGIEYIVSEQVFNTLPASEKRYWHPHNHAILSGGVMGPGLPNVAEKAFLEEKLNSYGKTWHTWTTGGAGLKADTMPLGPAQLGWTTTDEHPANPALVRERDAKLGVSMEEKRESRTELAPQAHPQANVSGPPAGATTGGGGSSR